MHDLGSWDLDRCIAELKSREKLLPTLVGWLYPSIVIAEINEINTRIDRILGGRLRKTLVELDTSHKLGCIHETI